MAVAEALPVSRWSKAVLVMMGPVVGERETTGPVQALMSSKRAQAQLRESSSGKRNEGSRRDGGALTGVYK
jgi:hypothetical protein